MASQSHRLNGRRPWDRHRVSHRSTLGELERSLEPVRHEQVLFHVGGADTGGFVQRDGVGGTGEYTIDLKKKAHYYKTWKGLESTDGNFARVFEGYCTVFFSRGVGLLSRRGRLK